MINNLNLKLKESALYKYSTGKVEEESMSYRELRNFTEILRCLGYHRNISIENFRDPNFQLVADILYWFALRYDPKADISDDIDTREDRVKFIKQVCQLFASKARI